VGAIVLALVLIGAGVATYFLFFKDKTEETVVEVKKKAEETPVTTSETTVKEETQEVAVTEEKTETVPTASLEVTQTETKETKSEEETLPKEEVKIADETEAETPKEEVKVAATKVPTEITPSNEATTTVQQKEEEPVVAQKTAVTGANESELAGTGIEHNFLWIILSLIVTFSGGLIYRLKGRKVKIKVR
jgi:outer membrane biosynthesis protein TonB